MEVYYSQRVEPTYFPELKYAIFNEQKGYMYEDEDLLPGTASYQHEIDEYTILFNSEEDAKFNCGKGDIVVAIKNPPTEVRG